MERSLKMPYNYKDSKERVDNILSSKTKIENKEKVPASDGEFTYSNGIRTWVGALFVDMVNSSKLCETADENTARIFRAFCSEIIAIMKDDENYRQIGIRGDCIYSINTTQFQEDLVNMFRTAYRINTFIKMFNKQLVYYGYNPIKAGIGLGCDKELVIKVGQVGSGINDKIWIGKAVVEACHLGDIANRNNIEPIAMSKCFYNNVHKMLEKENEKYKDWIKPYYSNSYTVDFYHCCIVQTDFDQWIEENC